MSEQKELIHQRMADILKDVSSIGKDQTNSQQGFKFRGIEDVMNALHEVFKKNEVFILTEVINHEYHEITTRSGSTGYHHLTRVQFHFQPVDGSRVTVTSLGEAMDYGDKGATKTLSISLKYALLNVFLIPTKETAEQDADNQTHQVVKLSAKEKVARALADDSKKWFEIQWPFNTPEKYKGSELSTVAAAGDVKSFRTVEAYLGDVLLEKYPQAHKNLDAAIAEASNNKEERRLEGEAQALQYEDAGDRE